MSIESDLQKVVTEEFSGRKVTGLKSISGGCINQAFQVTLDDGARLFIKVNQASLREMFAVEFRGLLALQATGCIRVPRPVAWGQSGAICYLVLEWLESGQRSSDFFSILGRSLAEMHLYRGAEAFGFECDNFIGSTPQPNGWQTEWSRFFIEVRLVHQLTLADRNGFELGPLFTESVCERVQHLLGTCCRPSLIHGDLWSGNCMAGPRGNPVLIDPAPYWGHREAEFGILTLFGGFPDDFFAAYRERFPLDEGFDERLPVYQLYHYLNHLNLFGATYRDACQDLLKRLA